MIWDFIAKIINFSLSPEQSQQNFWFLSISYQHLTCFWPKLPKSISLPRLKLPRRIPLARLEVWKGYLWGRHIPRYLYYSPWLDQALISLTMHWKTGSNGIVDTLHHLGLCISYIGTIFIEWAVWEEVVPPKYSRLSWGACQLHMLLTILIRKTRN